MATDPRTLTETADRDTTTEADPAGDALDQRTLRVALMRALETLDEREREVVTLLYGGELNAKEVAAQTGLGHANVRKIAQRAREALRVEIERALSPRGAASMQEGT